MYCDTSIFLKKMGNGVFIIDRKKIEIILCGNKFNYSDILIFTTLL